MFVNKMFSNMNCDFGFANPTFFAVWILDDIEINEFLQSSIELWIFFHHMSQDMFALVVQITTLDTTNNTEVFSFIGAVRHGWHVLMDFVSQFIAFWKRNETNFRVTLHTKRDSKQVSSAWPWDLQRLSETLTDSYRLLETLRDS